MSNLQRNMREVMNTNTASVSKNFLRREKHKILLRDTETIVRKKTHCEFLFALACVNFNLCQSVWKILICY